ncbi:hypothetical protein [Paludisphaera soli]|uniref:hypothetical protein n=1 Tax=Paludisphaera soli TaxID=2712865 RepID=UPI0013ECEB1B|nr:hypothetical protein [Paludisphaera soli]
MTRIQGAIQGLAAAPLAVTMLGAVLGFVGGWAPCRGVPYTLIGAQFGMIAFGGYLAPPAGLLGAAFGAAITPAVKGLSFGQLAIVLAADMVILSLIVTWTVFGFV